MPKALSNFCKICGLGIAFPDSYSWIIWGLSFIAVAKSFWVNFFANLAWVIALESSRSTVACLNSSVESSSFFRFDETAPWALLLSPAPTYYV